MRGIILLLAGACCFLPAAEIETGIADRIAEEELLRSGKTLAWIRAIEGDITREPSNADLHAALALGYFLLDQRRFAKQEIEQALVLDAHSVQANYIAGRIAMEQDKDYRPAIARFQEVLSVSKDNFKARYFLGICIRNLRRRDEAMREFRAASVNIPYDWALVAIAQGELDNGDPREALDAALNENVKARDYLEQALKADPSWDTPHYLLVRIYSETPGGQEKARAERERFESLRNAAL